MPIHIYEARRSGIEVKPCVHVQNERRGHFHETTLRPKGHYADAFDWGRVSVGSLETAYCILDHHFGDEDRARRYAAPFCADVIIRMPNVRFAFNSHFIEEAIKRYDPGYTPQPEAVFENLTAQKNERIPA